MDRWIPEPGTWPRSPENDRLNDGTAFHRSGRASHPAIQPERRQESQVPPGPSPLPAIKNTLPHGELRKARTLTTLLREHVRSGQASPPGSSGAGRQEPPCWVQILRCLTGPSGDVLSPGKSPDLRNIQNPAEPRQTVVMFTLTHLRGRAGFPREEHWVGSPKALGGGAAASWEVLPHPPPAMSLHGADATTSWVAAGSEVRAQGCTNEGQWSGAYS